MSCDLIVASETRGVRPARDRPRHHPGRRRDAAPDPRGRQGARDGHDPQRPQALRAARRSPPVSSPGWSRRRPGSRRPSASPARSPRRARSRPASRRSPSTARTRRRSRPGSSPSAARSTCLRLRGREGGPDRVHREAQAELRGPLSRLARLLEPPRLRTLEVDEERRATWLELFLDLVFVAAIAEVASTLGADPTAAGLRALPRALSPGRLGLGGLHVLRDPLRHRRPRLPAPDAARHVRGRRAREHRPGRLARWPEQLRHRLRRGPARPARPLRAGLPRPRDRAPGRPLVPAHVRVRDLHLARLARGPGALEVRASGPSPSSLEHIAPVRAWRMLRGVPVHPRHVPERFGLLIIIVLGESVIAVVLGTAEVSWTLRSGSGRIRGLPDGGVDLVALLRLPRCGLGGHAQRGQRDHVRLRALLRRGGHCRARRGREAGDPRRSSRAHGTTRSAGSPPQEPLCAWRVSRPFSSPRRRRCSTQTSCSGSRPPRSPWCWSCSRSGSRRRSILWLLAAVLVAQVALELATHEEHTAHAPGPL